MKIYLLPRFPSPRRYKVPRDLELGAVVPKSCGQSGRSFNRCREVARMFGFQSWVRHFLYITPNTDMDRVELGRYQWYLHHVVMVTTKESYLNSREIMTRNPFHSFDYTVFVSILEPVFTNLRPHEYKNHPLRRCWQCFASNERKKKQYRKRSLTLIIRFSPVLSVLILIYLVGGLLTNLKATHSPRSPSMYGARSMVAWGRRGVLRGNGCRRHRVMSRILIILIILIRRRLVYQEMHFSLLFLSTPIVPLS